MSPTQRKNILGQTLINLAGMTYEASFTQGFSGYDTVEVDSMLADVAKMLGRVSRKLEDDESKIEQLDVYSLAGKNIKKSLKGYDVEEVDSFVGNLVKAMKQVNEIL